MSKSKKSKIVTLSNRDSNVTISQNSNLDSETQSGSLGINAKSATPPREKDDALSAAKRLEIKAQQYLAQSVIGEILIKHGQKLKDKGELKYVYNVHRTTKCLRFRHSADVGVHTSKEFKTAFYSGLVTCAYVWGCPVCAAKIQERRRLEISKAFDYAYDVLDRKKVVMITITFPHYAREKLGDLLESQAQALHKMRSGNPWTKFKNRVGFEGLIRSLEVTHGRNGWHPHTHEAWIVDEHANPEFIRSTVARRWLVKIQEAGIEVKNEKAFLEHSIDVKDFASNSDYLAKQDDSKYWGADREIVKGGSKANDKTLDGDKNKTYHPFQLALSDSEKDKFKYLEYHFTMKGRRQIFWSRGLKDAVGINDATDEEIVAQQDDAADLLARLDEATWDMVLRGGKGARAELLKVAELEGASGIDRYLEELASNDEITDDPLARSIPVPREFDAKKAAKRQIENKYKKISRDEYLLRSEKKEEAPISDDPEDFCLTMEIDGV